MPELPDARRCRFIDSYGLPEYDAGQLTQTRALADFFEQTVKHGASPKGASNWMMGELARALNAGHRHLAESPVTPERLAGLLTLIENGTISGAIAKGVFEKMFVSGRTAEDIVKSDGLTQIDDASQIHDVIAAVLQANADAIAQYRAGKTSAFGFLVGQVMKATAGKANPKRVNEMLKKALDA
jgi:aspartyl-tRNA(Asn)/glutamyl-tRNA(Gln) amidotransferase subunit B